MNHPKNINNRYKQVIANEDFYKLLGLIISQGYVHNTGFSIYIDSNKKDIIAESTMLIRNVFDRKATISKDKREDVYALV